MTALYKYVRTDDLWVITSYYNPCGYKNRFDNYLLFYESMIASGLNLLTLECVFDNRPTLCGLHNVELVRGNKGNLMWQKERLLNLALKMLPQSAHKVAWLDCDILFDNEYWAVQTADLLDTYALVQPFQDFAILSPKQRACLGNESVGNGFAYILNVDPLLSSRGNYYQHGHTGFGWAGRREVLETHGFYDVLISANGDHFMAHAACGQFDSRCLQGVRDTALWQHFMRWALPFSDDVKGKIGFIEGRAMHLWHGTKDNRRYATTLDELLRHHFNPFTDVRVSKNGLLQWSTYKPQLHSWASRYFWDRNEDSP